MGLKVGLKLGKRKLVRRLVFLGVLQKSLVVNLSGASDFESLQRLSIKSNVAVG